MVTNWIHPTPGNYIPYQKTYFDQVPPGNLVQIMNDNRDQLVQWLEQQNENFGDFRYASDKWTVKEVMNHINDTERIMAYRALTFARGDLSELPGFEQDDYVMAAPISEFGLKQLTQEFISIREASISLITTFNDELIARKGIANGSVITVNALCYVIAGHAIHHFNILKERYS